MTPLTSVKSAAALAVLILPASVSALSLGVLWPRLVLTVNGTSEDCRHTAS